MKYIFLLFHILISLPGKAQTDSFSTMGLFTHMPSDNGYLMNGYRVELNDITPYLGKTVRVTGQFSVHSIPQHYAAPQEGQPELPPSYTYLIKNPKVEIRNEDLTRFKKKLDLTLWLVKTKPAFQQVMKQPIDGFRFNAPNRFNDNLTDADGNTLRVYLHSDTRQIVFVELTENKTLKQKIMSHLIQTLSYNWVGSEHLCDYLNNGTYALQICPDSEYAIQIHVSRMAD